jgi:csm2 family CRISPR-associated protein
MAKKARKPHSFRRTSQHEYTKVLVCTEGSKTEPQYFERMGQTIQETYKVSLTVESGKHSNPETVVKTCINKMEKYSRTNPGSSYAKCFVVVDVDHHNLSNGKLSQLKKAFRLAKQHGIEVLVSNVKFEVWLLWHVVDHDAYLESTELDDLCESCNILKEKKRGKKKNKTIAPDFPFQNWKEACKRANQHGRRVEANSIGENPSSALPRLFEALEALAAEQQQQ